MKRSNTWFALILIASALLLSAARNASAASQDHRTQQHKRNTAPQTHPIEEQKPQVPLAIWQATVSALRESITDNKQQAIAAQKQAEANKQTFCSPAVVVNEILAAVGIFYLVLMYLQWKAIDEQAKIASDTLALANRPKIKMRGFYVKADIDQDATSVKSWEMEIGYELVNYGGTEATVIDSRHTVLMNDVGRPTTLTMPPPYGGDQIAPQGTVFEPGKAYSFSIKGTVSPESRSQLQPFIESERRAAAMHFQPYCLGYVAYRGRIGNSYRTAFCRSLSRRMLPRPYVFETSKDPDYEYED